MELRDTVWAWLAGYVDRASCITVGVNYQPVIVFSSTSRDVLDEVQAALGDAGLPEGHIKTYWERRAAGPRFQLVIYRNDEVARVLHAIGPFLRIRAGEAALLLEIIGENRKGSDLCRTKRDELVRQMRELKRERGTLRG